MGAPDLPLHASMGSGFAMQNQVGSTPSSSSVVWQTLKTASLGE